MHLLILNYHYNPGMSMDEYSITVLLNLLSWSFTYIFLSLFIYVISLLPSACVLSESDTMVHKK